MNIDVIKLIIEALAVILPSTITVATLLKKKYYRQSLQTISQKIDNIVTSSDKKINEIHEDLKAHGLIIKEYCQTQDVSIKLRDITKHALQCCNNLNTKKILVKFTQQFINFIKEILDLSLQHISKQQFISKLLVAMDNTNFYAKQIYDAGHVGEWKQIIDPYVQRYNNEVIELIFDKLNNKNNRFIIKSLDLAHTIVKQYVLYCANLDYNVQNIQDD